MKDAKEVSGFLAKAFAIFLAMNLVVAFIYVGSLLRDSYKSKHYEKYLNDISQVSLLLTDPLVDSLTENNYKFASVVITTSEKDDFNAENIKTVEFNRHGVFNIKIYIKGGYVSFNPKWLIPHITTVNDIDVKYIHKYNSMIRMYATEAVFKYNNRKYKITINGEKAENITEITKIVKAME